MPSAEFEPVIPAIKRLRNYAIDHKATIDDVLCPCITTSKILF